MVVVDQAVGTGLVGHCPAASGGGGSAPLPGAPGAYRPSAPGSALQIISYEILNNEIWKTNEVILFEFQ